MTGILSELRQVEAHVIIGNGVAGRAVAEELVAGGVKRVVLIGREHPVPISRPGLMYRAMGAMRTADLELPVPAGVEAKWGEVVAWSAADRWVEVKGGERLAFAELIWAAGSVSRPFPGPVSVPCYHLQTLADAETLAGLRPKRWGVVGGGLVGAELAEWGRSRGAETHWFVRDARLWSDWLNVGESEALMKRVEGFGVQLHMGVALSALGPQVGGVEVDAVGVAIGVDPAPVLGHAAHVHVLPQAKSWEEAQRTGRSLGRTLTGRPPVPMPRVVEERLRCFDRSVAVLAVAPPVRELGWLDAEQARSLRIGVDAAGRLIRVAAMGLKLRANRVREALEAGLSFDQIPVTALFNEPEGTRLPIEEWAQLQPVKAT